MTRKFYIIIFGLLLSFSCSRESMSFEEQIAIDRNDPATVLDTLLHVDYETGTTSSGIKGVKATHATAPDAAYVTSPGNSSTYAIAHKVVHGDEAYISAGNYRSESDADYAENARFFPGEERRYEFSLLLKDWPEWKNGDPVAESNLFQLKTTGPNRVPLQIRTTRNAIRVRYANSAVVDIIPDVRSYINRWIHFRIDVLWTSTHTGYIKTYVKLPGSTDYELKAEQLNYLTYTGSGIGGQHGYIKWGVYIVPPNLTHIAYHDNIRIIALN